MSSTEQNNTLHNDSLGELTTVCLDNNQVRRPSIMDKIKEKQNDQDFQQKMNVASTLVLEIYRVLMGAFLVVFVPQKCDDTICSMNQNINRDDILSQVTMAFNAVTMLTFLFLYFVEVKRENKLINYLEVNRFTPVDNESVGDALEKLSTIKKESILKLDKYYQKAGYISTATFIINAVLSSIVVYSHYLDSKTVTVYLTITKTNNPSCQSSPPKRVANQQPESPGKPCSEKRKVSFICCGCPHRQFSKVC